ncbi:hypothetical protein P3S67_006557 [Capsicum chacoense]
MRDVDKASAASKEKISLSKFDLDEIKSFVSTYIDMKFNDLQKLMTDQYIGLLGVVKEGFDSFGKVAQYPVHESEKGYPDIEEDPPQSVNEHTTDAKSYNVVNVVGQSSRLGENEGASKEFLKEAESLYTDKLKEDGGHSTNAEVDEAINKECVTESEEALHNTDEDLSNLLSCTYHHRVLPIQQESLLLQILSHSIGRATLIVNVILVTAILQLFLMSLCARLI